MVVIVRMQTASVWTVKSRRMAAWVSRLNDLEQKNRFWSRRVNLDAP